jgi:hypothetical protein
MAAARRSDRSSRERGATLAELAVALALFTLVLLGVGALWAKSQEAFVHGAELAEIQQSGRAALDFLVRELRTVGRDVTGCAFDFVRTATADCDGDKVAACQLRLGGAYDADNGLPGGGPGCTALAALPFQEATASSIRIRADRNDNGRVVGMGNAITSGADADRAEEDVTYALTVGAPCPSGVARCLTRDDGSGRVALVGVAAGGFRLTYYPRPGFGPCAAVGSPPVIPDPCPPYALPLASQEEADQVARIRVELGALGTVAGRPVTRTLTTDVALRNRW